MAAFPADTARLMPTPEPTDQFMKLETKLPLWLAMPMRPAGGYGATICAQSFAGVDTTPWPLGPAIMMLSAWAKATNSCWAKNPSGPASP